MKATRTVPGRPVNDSNSATAKIIDLVAETLSRSPSLDGEEIRDELQSAKAALGLLGTGGHLRRGELVLMAATLRLRIDVPVGDQALIATEHVDPPRGAATADSWTLHLPVPDTLAAIVKAASKSCPHVSLEPAPTEAQLSNAHAVAATIDLSKLTNQRGPS